MFVVAFALLLAAQRALAMTPRLPAAAAPAPVEAS